MADFFGKPMATMIEVSVFIKQYINQHNLKCTKPYATSFIPDKNLEKFFGTGKCRITSIHSLMSSHCDI